MNEKQRRIIMTIGGVLLSGFCVGMFNFSMFGMDPFQVFAHGTWVLLPIGFGTYYAILNLLMLVFIFFLDKKKIGLGTMINIFILGYMVQFSSWLFETLIPTPHMWIRITILIIGLIFLCLASALYFTGDLGVSTYDAIGLLMSEKGIAKYQYCRIATDLICVLIGFSFGAVVGIGTLVTAFFMGPMITFFKNRVAIPFRYKNTTPDAA